MKIAVFGQVYQNDTLPIIRDIFNFLNKEAAEIFIEQKFLDILHDQGILEKKYNTYTSNENLPKDAKLLISIGGDGTILRAVTYVKDSGIPILGINAGRLGFLAKAQKGDIERFLKEIFQGNFTISPRTMLSLESTVPNAAFENVNYALNEVCITKKDTASMITIETYVNDEYLTSYWADGLIISTPTGSTGYSLSCGGPVLTPDVNSIVITPIAPHNLNARPLVLPDHVTVRIRVSNREPQYLTTLDSRIATFDSDVELSISKTPFRVNMVEIENETFLKTLRNKMLWGEDRRN